MSQNIYGSCSDTFHVVGLAAHKDSLQKLAKLNPDWSLPVEQLIAEEKTGLRIYKLKFTSGPVSFQQDPSTDALNVSVGGNLIGYIKPEETAHAKNILKNKEIQNIFCGIWGGQYRLIDDFGSEETGSHGISVSVRIVYEDDIPVESPATIPDPKAKSSSVYTGEEPTKPKKEKKEKKTKKKKPFFKRLWFWVIIGIVVFSILSPSDSAAEAPDPVETMESAPTTILEAIATDSAVETTAESITTEALAGMIRLAMSEDFTGYDISCDGDTITVNVWMDGVASGALYASSGNEALKSSWDEMVSNQISLCNSMCELSETFGRSDVIILYNVLNDQNLDNTLLSIMNGTVVYDSVNNQAEAQSISPSNVTTGEKNALKSAQNYLSLMAFSYSGLIEQLEYEGYTTAEATYAADNCGADWNEQASKSAKNYLDLMAFSKEGLIDQLEWEGFTKEQAVYGAEQNGY